MVTTVENVQPFTNSVTRPILRFRLKYRSAHFYKVSGVPRLSTRHVCLAGRSTTSCYHKYCRDDEINFLKTRVTSSLTARQPIFYNAQHTPPTPTRRNCRVEWRRLRRCEHNLQLAHNDCRRVRSRRRHDATRLADGKFVQTRRNRRQLVANSVHTADATQLDSKLRRVVTDGA